MASRFIPGRVLGYLLRGKNGSGGFAVVIKGFKCYGRMNSLEQLMDGAKDYIILVGKRGAEQPVGYMSLSRDRRQFVIKSEQNGVVLAGWAKNLSAMLRHHLSRAPVHERLTRRAGAGFPPLDGMVGMRGGRYNIMLRPRGGRYGISLTAKEAAPLLKFSVPYRIPLKGIERGPLTIRPEGGRIKIALRGGGTRREITTTRRGLDGAIRGIEKKIYTTFRINSNFVEGLVPFGWDIMKDGGCFVLTRGAARLVVRFCLEKPLFPSSSNTKIVRQVGHFWVEGIAYGGGGGAVNTVRTFVGSLCQK